MIRRSLLAIFLSMCSVVVWAVPGDLDMSFNLGTGANSAVYTMVVQADGKILVGGDFTSYNGVVRNRIARLNPDGSLDMSFNLGAGANSAVYTMVVQADGKILMGGDFTSVNGVARNRVARLNADGSFDTSFDPGSGANLHVFTMGIQADGKILVGGHFTSYGGQMCNYIARLNADGSLDTSFNLYSGANYIVETIVAQADGKILIGGWFTSYNGVARNRVARLNADGSLDTSFNPGSGVDQYYVYTMDVQADGKILIGGWFTNYNGVARNHIARLNPDGSLDISFIPGSGASEPVRTFSVQADGKILVGGEFTSYNGVARNYIARLNADGSLDTSFNPAVNGADYPVDTMAMQADGKVLIGGLFTSYNGVARNYIARIESRSKVKNNLDADNDSDLLTRSASLGTWTRHTIQNAAITGSAAINIPTSSDTVYVAQLDANGDGDADVLTRSASTGNWTLHEVQAGAVVGSYPISLYSSAGYQFVGAGDFNNDGVDDVMLRDATAGYRTFLLKNHAVDSSVFYNAWISADSVDQGIGDFDGDGTDDLLVRKTSNNQYYIFKTTNGATSSNACACNLWKNPDWTFQFAGDTNKDGIDDIIIRGTGASGDGKWWAFRMANFYSQSYTNLNLFYNKTRVSLGGWGDYNADGVVDVLTRVDGATTYVSPLNNGLVVSNTRLADFTVDQAVLK